MPLGQRHIAGEALDQDKLRGGHGRRQSEHNRQQDKHDRSNLYTTAATGRARTFCPAASRVARRR